MDTACTQKLGLQTSRWDSHDCDVTTILSPPSATPTSSTAMVAELIKKHDDGCLLGPVRADQSEQTGPFGRALKRQALKWRKRENKGVAQQDSMR